MVSNPPEGAPRIAPYLLYEDAGAGGDFLVNAFGFKEHFRLAGPDGKVMHAEYGIHGEVVMIGCPGVDYTNPNNTDGNLALHEVPANWQSGEEIAFVSDAVTVPIEGGTPT